MILARTVGSFEPVIPEDDLQSHFIQLNEQIDAPFLDTPAGRADPDRAWFLIFDLSHPDHGPALKNGDLSL